MTYRMPVKWRIILAALLAVVMLTALSVAFELRRPPLVTAGCIVVVFFLILVKPEVAKSYFESWYQRETGNGENPVWFYRLLGAFGIALGLLVFWKAY